MKIGFDVDGVLADFVTAYQRLVVKTDGRDLFAPDDIKNPPCWDWPQFRGYSEEVVKQVWASIIDSPDFWYRLQAHRENMSTLAMVYPDIAQRHDIYFITSRPSNHNAKRQTEEWLEDRGIYRPTVLISSEKGVCCEALKLDAYIDDYNVNIERCIETRMRQRVRGQKPTKVFMLERSYNREAMRQSIEIIRVGSVGQMLDYLVMGL